MANSHTRHNAVQFGGIIVESKDHVKVKIRSTKAQAFKLRRLPAINFRDWEDSTGQRQTLCSAHLLTGCTAYLNAPKVCFLHYHNVYI
jgi:hypothetical protein